MSSAPPTAECRTPPLTTPTTWLFPGNPSSRGLSSCLLLLCCFVVVVVSVVVNVSIVVGVVNQGYLVVVVVFIVVERGVCLKRRVSDWCV